MSLKKYQSKRKFFGKNRTNEPKPKLEKQNKKQKIFVVHKHHASHLHWDLRLEMNGVLKSWAVPKEPPLKKGIKRLAIQVEDHPLEYANFKGTIPEGHYGAGKVEIWDKGNYELKNKDEKKIEFILNGKKLKGNFVLVKTSYGKKPEKSWLWFKI
ncbi:MAG: 3'-phosphoesterase [Candidatus Pacearchaeota archaeon]|nr:MAG: 3'-phosphoesterase [Candidatus Pacearchaeota archaeon]